MRASAAIIEVGGRAGTGKSPVSSADRNGIDVESQNAPNSLQLVGGDLPSMKSKMFATMITNAS
jgi:hypothetical protein